MDSERLGERLNPCQHARYKLGLLLVSLVVDVVVGIDHHPPDADAGDRYPRTFQYRINGRWLYAFRVQEQEVILDPFKRFVLLLLAHAVSALEESLLRVKLHQS